LSSIAQRHRAVAQTEIHPTPADGVFPFQGPIAIDHPMQKGHQHQVGRDFVIGRAAQQRLAMLPPEGQEGGQQTRRVQAAIGFSQVGADLRQGGLRVKARARGNTSR
jgi:hypothetical protein